MQGNETRDRLDREAAERERAGRKRKKIQRLVSVMTLAPQPFTIFEHMVQAGNFFDVVQNNALRHFQTFEEVVRFLLCAVAEIGDRIEKKELDAVKAPDLFVERIVHGVVCHLEVEKIFQLARDFGLLSDKGNIQNFGVVPLPSAWQIDISFLAVAKATDGVVGTAKRVATQTPEMEKGWEEAIEKRLR